MIEVFRDMSSARVGLYNSMLESAGIPTMVRNWNAITMTTEIPIPVMYPNICVFNEEDAKAAREIIAGLADDASEDLPDGQMSEPSE
ncbi:putative signal transducing protein [Cerasicoccus maritimus]|uniref:putative signal transducing protein n=1 Tax=Cerasicoccus maritimus TaxID=490089 RepID=UPI0028525651|nr:DUF2007 domain-containing protein [Cerasicoccus maritimus]